MMKQKNELEMMLKDILLKKEKEKLLKKFNQLQSVYNEEEVETKLNEQENSANHSTTKREQTNSGAQNGYMSF